MSLAALIGISLLRQTYQAANNVLIKTHVDPVHRGRVLSTLTLDRGLVPAGTMMAALGSAAMGVQGTIAIMRGALVVLALVVAWLAPTLRSLEARPGARVRRHLAPPVASARAASLDAPPTPPARSRSCPR